VDVADDRAFGHERGVGAAPQFDPVAYSVDLRVEAEVFEGSGGAPDGVVGVGRRGLALEFPADGGGPSLGRGTGESGIERGVELVEERLGEHCLRRALAGSHAVEPGRAAPSLRAALFPLHAPGGVQDVEMRPHRVGVQARGLADLLDRERLRGAFHQGEDRLAGRGCGVAGVVRGRRAPEPGEGLADRDCSVGHGLFLPPIVSHGY